MQPELPPEQPAIPKPSLWQRTKSLTASLWQRTKSLGRRIGGFCSRWWRILKPTREVRRGIYIAVILFVPLWWAIFSARDSRFFGLWIDGLGWWLVAVLILILGGLVGALALWLIHKIAGLPRLVTGFLVVAGAAMSRSLPGPLPGPVLLLLVALLGATLASMLTSAWREMARARRVLTIILLVVAISGLATAAAYFIWDGTQEGLVKYQPTPLPPGQLLSAPDPSEPGPFKVLSLTYGAGTDLRRPEYGRNVIITSRTVDGSLLLKDIEGWKGKVYKWWWGFDTSKMPLNARVWYPRGDGPFPLVLIVHGNHNGRDFSDLGYAYLGELLASRGYIFASIDENFINGQMPAGFGMKETAARGWLLLEHLRQFRDFNATPGNRFYKKVDMDRIGLMGHSRGGEAVATAFEFNRLKRLPGDANQALDYGFHIRALIAIAPADGQYKPAGVPRKLRDVNYFVIHGSHDFDVSSFTGSSQYQRVSFSEGFPGFKASLYIYRANHGQFNTVWDRHDWGPPGVYMMNLGALLTGQQQRRIAQVYFSAFLDATLRDKREYRALFEDARRGEKWLPKTIYRSLYQDASFREVAGFDEDYEPVTATAPGATLAGDNLAVWREERVALRFGERTDAGVVLGWRKDSKASYTVSLPANFAKLGAGATLEFTLADNNETPPPPKDKDKDKKDKDKDKQGKDKKKDEKKDDSKKEKEPIDLTVELADTAGRTARLALSDLGPLCPPLRVKYLKLKLPGFNPYTKDVEPVFQRYSAPLAAFAARTKGFDATRLKSIRFVFDKTQDRVVVLDDIGIASVAAQRPAAGF